MIDNGVNALDLADSPEVSTETFAKSMAILQANFGAEFNRERVSVLFDLIRKDGWSETRFTAVVEWFLKNKRFPTWTIADWYDYGIKVYPEAWYRKRCTESYNPLPHLDRYRLPDGTIVYREKDGQTIPGLEKLPDWTKSK